MNSLDNPGERRPAADCWCGAASFREFGPAYLECTTCGTLVSQVGLSREEIEVVDDDSDFYGKKYWLDHQQEDLDYPGFSSRTRNDLPERNLYWLRTLLKYRTPPARVIELGCAHGSFVALMQQAGFQASGVEMSPWVVSYGKATFGIDVQVGPVESLDIARGSLDAIAMMDVMEHLPDPVATMSYCLDLLKPDGILLIQMPDFVEGIAYQTLVDTNAPFLEQLKEDEHLYLYSKRSAAEFFRRIGAAHIAFEPAIFAHYDMCLVVSRSPLATYSQDQIDASLQTPGGRIALAMLDMKDRYDRAPVLQQQVDSSDALLNELYQRADALGNERNLAQAQLADLQRNFVAAEHDRAERMTVIEGQGRRISELEGLVHQRLEELNVAYARLEGVAQAQDADSHIAAIERDREARAQVIEAQGQRIAELEAEVHKRLEELNGLYGRIEEMAQQRNAEQAHLQFVEQDRADRVAVIQSQGARVSELEAIVHQRLQELEGLYVQLENGRNERNMALAELEHVRGQFEFVQGDRSERAAVIEAQGQRIASLESQVHKRLEELNALYPTLDQARQALDVAHQRVTQETGLLASERQRAAELDALLVAATGEVERVQAALQEHASEAIRLQDQLVDQEKAFLELIFARDAEMEALKKRWWWKLGSFIKAL